MPCSPRLEICNWFNSPWRRVLLSLAVLAATLQALESRAHALEGCGGNNLGTCIDGNNGVRICVGSNGNICVGILRGTRRRTTFALDPEDADMPFSFEMHARDYGPGETLPAPSDWMSPMFIVF